MRTSELTPLYRGHPEISAALAAIPGWTDLVAAVSRCEAAITERKGSGADGARDAFIDRTAAALTEGQDLGAAFDADAYTAVNCAEVAEASLGILDGILARLTDDLDTATRGGTNTILARLNDRLQDTIRTARALDLDGAADAEQAIAVGAAEAWAELVKLRGDYFRLRDSQARVMRSLAPNTDARPDDFGFLANSAELFPHWHRYDGGQPHLELDGTLTHVERPWPDDPTDRFRWLLEHPEAQPWIPTRAQLATATNDARAVAAAASAPTPAQREAQQVEARRQEIAMKRAREAAAWSAA